MKHCVVQGEEMAHKDLRGVHWGNFKWLDPFGVFPQKPPERPGMSDVELYESMLRKAILSRAQSVKITLSTYLGDPNAKLWLNIQHWIVLRIHQRFPDAALIFRLEHLSYAGLNVEEGLAKAPLMARDFAPIINRLTHDIRSSGSTVPIWIIIANEPNHPHEGFGQDPTYFNRWFKEVVWHFWNVYLIPDHGLFYPGLSQNFDALGWYQHPSTKEIIQLTIVGVRQGRCNGVSVHVYWQTGHIHDPQWGEVYRILWQQGVKPVNPHMPIIIGEWGNSSFDDMNTVKTPEYVEWLTQVMIQDEVPYIIATNGYIIDGTHDWKEFRWTEHTAQTIGNMSVP